MTVRVLLPQMARCSSRYLCASRSSSRLLNAAPPAGVRIGDVGRLARSPSTGEKHMLKKLFVTAAAAAAVSVPLAGAAWADKPADPGAGNQGVPDRATAAVVNILQHPPLDLNGQPQTPVPEPVISAFIAANQSGKSGNVAPGTAFSIGAKTDCASAGGGTVKCNTPDGYGVALNTAYSAFGIDPASVNPDGEYTVRAHHSGVGHRELARKGATQGSSGVCPGP